MKREWLKNSVSSEVYGVHLAITRYFNTVYCHLRTEYIAGVCVIIVNGLA